MTVKEKEFIINGVSKKESEITIEDLEHICMGPEVSLTFLEKYLKYLSRGALKNLSFNKQILTRETLNYLKGWAPLYAETEQGDRSRYFFKNWFSTVPDLPQWVLEEYESELNWNVLSVFYDAETIIKKYPNKLIDSAIVHNNSFGSLISKEYRKELLESNYSNDFKGLYKYILKTRIDPYARLSELLHLDKEMLEVIGADLDAEGLAKNENTPKELIVNTLMKRGEFSKRAFTYGRKFTEEEMLTYEKHIDWSVLSEQHPISENMLRRNKDLVDWVAVSSKQKLTTRFIEEFKDKLYFGELLENESNDFSELIKIKGLTDVDRLFLANRRDAPEEFVENIIDRRVNIGRSFWSKVSRNKKVSEEFLEKYKEELLWGLILRERALSRSFIEKNIDYLDLDRAIQNKWIPISLIEELETLIEFKEKF